MVNITNEGPEEAYNVGAVVLDPSIASVSGSCSSPLAVGSSCQLTFSPGIVGSTTAAIDGDNTNQVTLPITVSPLVTLSAPSSLVLATDGIFTTAATGLNINTCPTVWNNGGYCQSQARKLIITNGSSNDALDVTFNFSPDLPLGTNVFPLTCGTIQAGGTCEVTITPGMTPSTTEVTAPAPSTMTIEGSNTLPINTDITLITYGNLYTVSTGQFGYIPNKHQNAKF